MMAVTVKRAPSASERQALESMRRALESMLRTLEVIESIYADDPDWWKPIVCTPIERPAYVPWREEASA